MFKKITALVATLALTFVGLTAIAGPIQQANAFTSPICGPTSGSAGPVTATTVNYGGKLFDIIGYNKDGNRVGVAGDTNNSVTLLLDGSEATSYVQWTTFGNAYEGSTFSSVMEAFATNLGTDVGIIERTLTGGSSNYGFDGYNEDYIKGSNVTNQKVWPLSVDEVSHLILSSRVFSSMWWLRTPGSEDGRGALVDLNGLVYPGGGYGIGKAVRPALYLDITSEVFSGITFNTQLPIGACQAEYTNLGIDYTAETVTGLDMASQGWKIGTTYAGLSSFVQQTGTAISITDSISSSPSSLVFVKASDDNDHFDSDKDRNNQPQESLATTINIPARPVAPILSIVENTISNVTTNMEYNATAANYDGTWTAIVGTTLSGLPDGTYYIRDKAVAGPTGHFKSFAATAEIVRIPETTPTLALDYTNETVTGFDTSTSGFKTASTEAGLTGASCAQLVTGTSDIASTITNSSKTLWTKKCATDGNHSDSTTTSIVIPARPVAPTISATAPTFYGLGDGFVGGLTTNKEYNTTSATYDGAWTPVTGTSVDNLSAGDKICVRTVAEASVKFKSLGSCVTVGQGVKPAPAKPVKPKPVSTKAKKAKGSITFIWGASGFLTTVEVYYRVKGSSKWKVVRVSGADRKKIKLKRNKTYQFQLRSCKTVKGKNYYSAWTKKTIKA